MGDAVDKVELSLVTFHRGGKQFTERRPDSRLHEIKVGDTIHTHGGKSHLVHAVRDDHFIVNMTGKKIKHSDVAAHTVYHPGPTGEMV